MFKIKTLILVIILPLLLPIKYKLNVYLVIKLQPPIMKYIIIGIRNQHAFMHRIANMYILYI